MNDLEATFARFNESMIRVQASFRRLAYKMRLLQARTKKARRRIERDYARANRRPALIHKGGKP